MLTIQEIISSKTRERKRPDDGELKKFPYKHAFIYGRLSSPGQVRDSRESIREIARLVDLAKKDGYRTNLNPSDIEAKLVSMQKVVAIEGIWSDREVTVDVRDLGISGQLSFEDRKGLSELQRRVKEGTVGALYLTEGVSRLSRDRDHILPYQLLKLLKENRCRIRTPEGVWNPAIERDWDYLAGEFEEAIGELRVMNRRMFRRKVQKAGHGEYVGEPVPAGFVLPVTGRKPSGKYEYGKMEPYPAHAEMVKRILEEYVRQGGSCLKTCRSLEGMTIPLFPEELQYMERLTILRMCPKTSYGYKITRSLVRGLATNLKMIGVWQWGDGEPIMDNHRSAASRELFLEAYALANVKKKPRGRAIDSEPNEWSGLLQCMNHPEPRRIYSINSKGRYICNRDFIRDGEKICLDITARFLDEPLTAAVVGQLDLTPFAEEVLSKLESDTGNRKLEEIHLKQQITRLEEGIKKWQALLPCCVDSLTGRVDREKEEYYWSRIREAQKQLEEIKVRPVPGETQNIDYGKVKDFLKGISQNWYTYSCTSRNRLLKLIIEKVEIRGIQDIEATIIWKNGFRQKILIHRPPSNSRLESRWTKDEDNLLRMMYPSSSSDVLKAALADKSWKAIRVRASRLKLKRTRGPNRWRKWTSEDDERLKLFYRQGMDDIDIAGKLGRSAVSITKRVRDLGLNQPNPNEKRETRVSWEISDLIPSHELSSRGGQRG
jgi:hypothetical protein